MPAASASSLRPCADWRDIEQYRHLLDYDRAGWAVEWLRRNPAFIADAHNAPCLPHLIKLGSGQDIPVMTCENEHLLSRWGLHGCYMGKEPYFFWLPEVNPLVLMLDAEHTTNKTDAFNIFSCPLFKAAFRDARQQTHILFGDGARTLQIMIKGSIMLDDPILFRCVLTGWGEIETKPLSLRRLCCLHRQGRLLSSLYPKEQRAHRWIEMLRAWDGLQTGAKQREIGSAIYSDRAAHEDWDAGYRARVQRLLHSSDRMVGGGYLDFLQGKHEHKAYDIAS